MSNRISSFLTDEGHTDTKAHAFLGRFLKAERRIYGYILTLLPRPADAEDVLQESSAIMWAKFDEQDPPRDFVAWGCRIAFYRVQLYRRGRKRGRVVFSDTMLERVAETMAEEANALGLDDRLDALDRCLEKLPRDDRELLARRFVEGATPRTTAETCGRSVDAIYKAMARIRKALYDCVTRTLAAEERG
jgi:RNA polymerase sigma-70 factor (ECF subfamily)